MDGLLTAVLGLTTSAFIIIVYAIFRTRPDIYEIEEFESFRNAFKDGGKK